MAFARGLVQMLGVLALLNGQTQACTTLIAGRLATTDGSVMCTHSNDGEGATDPRLVSIPARTHNPGAKRAIFFTPESIPRYVGTARGDIPAYAPTPLHKPFEPIGYIPEVPKTYRYFEETYGAMNEHQLAIGESTCSGVFGTLPKGQGGKALMSVDTLTQLAMERTTTSRDAVKLMGAMAERYGFYGPGSFEGSAESLMVTDPHEGFIFHILPDESGSSAIWAAQRVPDDHVAVVANAFVIRQINVSDPTNFLFSRSVHETATAKGWWSPKDGPLDFTAIYSDGEYKQKYYSGRRVWGAYRLLSPSLNLSPTYDEYRKSKPYPVTAKPDEKVSVAAFARVMRCYYERTEFDATVGLAAGPWGTPDHVAGGSAGGLVGGWERTIGLFRTSDSHIAQSRSWLPDAVGGVLWWGPHAAPYTVYVPFAAGMVSLPSCTLGTPAVMDRSSLFWAVRLLFNYAQLRRSAMIVHINEYQEIAHNRSLKLQAQLDALGSKAPFDVLTSLMASNAESIRNELYALADSLLFRYADGLDNVLSETGVFTATAPAFPDDWLRAVNYTAGPEPISTRTHTPSKTMA